MTNVPIRLYSEAELDELYEKDPVEAMRISRLQHAVQAGKAVPVDTNSTALDAAGVKEAVEEARAILQRDGGDIELVAIEGNVVKVRMKGACVGCPSAPLDLKNVVEKILKTRYPELAKVVNTF